MHARWVKKGRGLIHGTVTFPCDNHYDHRMPRGHTISVLSLAVWWAKLDKVRYNMAQIASLLAVATVYIGFMDSIYSQEGGLTHKTKLPMQEHELKMRVTHARGGHNRGIQNLW